MCEKYWLENDVFLIIFKNVSLNNIGSVFYGVWLIYNYCYITGWLQITST